METKDTIRRLVKERRGQAAPGDLDRDSSVIFRKIRQMDAYIMANWIYVYADFRNEVKTQKFIAQALADGKQTALPRVEGDGMNFYRIDSLKDLEPGTMGILEPKKKAEPADSETALVIVPGVAFDPDCRRIGYGGGYYDRYLSRHAAHTTIGVGFEFQIFSELPADGHDVPVDYLVTESRTFSRGSRFF